MPPPLVPPPACPEPACPEPVEGVEVAEGQAPAPQDGLSEAEEQERRFAAYEATQPAAAVAAAEELPEPAAQPAPTLTLEEASKRLGPGILRALEAKFNGSLAEVRAPDPHDQLFR